MNAQSHHVDNLLSQSFQFSNGARLQNRLVKSALSEALGNLHGHATPELVQLYRTWSASGIGLLVTGNVMIDRRALGEPGNVVVEDASGHAMLSEWAQAGNRNGTQLWMQINHPGKQAFLGLNRETVAPSAIGFGPALAPFFPVPRALTSSEIEDLIVRYGRTAGLAKAAGFKGVQMHGAHGYLISQFLSPHHNQRDDNWGGDAERRRRFVLEAYGEIRRVVGADFPVGIKLNSADFQRGGFTEDESLATIRSLANAGIDLVEISGGTYESPAMVLGGAKASTLAREAYFLDFADKVRKEVAVPLMVTGGFRTAAGMNAALASGGLDLVGIGRLMAIEPQVAERLLPGEDPLHQLRAIQTGIRMIDEGGSMEITWYTRQLHRIGRGRAPVPNESGLKSFLLDLPTKGWGIFKTRRMRARAGNPAQPEALSLQPSVSSDV